MAITTYGVTLEYRKKGAEGEFAKLTDLKTYPDLGAAPASIETTNLSSESQTFVKGVKGMAAMEFTANYDKEVFAQVIALEEDELEYRISFQDKSAYTFSGSHSAWIVGGGINVAVDMKMTVVPSSKIEKAA